ncbi:MAG: prepilin-type N-terminal cleavage/methylation domain-containing protein [Chthoniobacterales bacterium]
MEDFAGSLGARPVGMRRRSFTIVEVLVVMAIILVLAGLVLATSSYVHNKGARSRAEAEIAAMSAALENYKADNGVYPSGTATTSLDARAAAALDPATYKAASLLLYEQLSGDLNNDRVAEARSYFAFKDNQLSPATGDVMYIKDPFGNSYGYSTIYQTDPAKGYNPTFDLWSTAGSTTSAAGWIKNW